MSSFIGAIPQFITTCSPRSTEASVKLLFDYDGKRRWGVLVSVMEPAWGSGYPMGLLTAMNQALDTQTVSMLLVDVAGRTDMVSIVNEIDVTTWGLAFDGGQDCLLELDEGGAGATLSAGLGFPIESRKADVFSAALTYNAMWRDTHATRIVQAGAEGELLIVMPLSGDAIRSDDFATFLQHFKHMAAFWSAYVAHDGSGDPMESPPFNYWKAAQP